MSRRKFLTRAGVGVAGFAASSSILAACTTGDDSTATTAAGGGATATTAVDLSQTDAPEIEWEMATSWPLSLPTLFGGAEIFTSELSRITGGKFKITPRAAGEIVGGLEVLTTVRDGGVQSGHTASYYYVGTSPATQFGTAVPFGLTERQQNAWLYEGGGLEIMQSYYAEEFGVIQFPAGNTGVQMGGWFTRELNSVADIQGLKMRIPGLAGQVLNNLGGEQITVAGGDILPSIETGAIDAAEFVGPTDDLILGLDQLGSQLFYYHPGWWEPGSTLEVEFPLSLWNELPEEYQVAIELAAKSANIGMMARYDVLNSQDLAKVEEFAEIREFPAELMTAFKTETESVLDDVAAGDAKFAEILGPWREFRDQVQKWHALAEASMLRAADL
ncbi:MAG: ABC transporter substrate-binding protein [Acidimicrobiia bacterium]|nr:ABC transporter substrate-binding protein [Acidimicrobiia bacterium]NNF65658.1 ABC transporter substrate-binding protein [Acidimicrobiia bacterium]